MQRSDATYLRTSVFAVALLHLLLIHLALPALQAAPPQIYLDANGLALGGYDLMAYFTEGVAREGSQQFEAEFKGARFRFTSAANLKQFQSDPEKILPQFQGYCAYALAAGKIRKCDPRRFAVRDGKLYLFSSSRAEKRWSVDRGNLLAKAIDVWHSFLQ